MQINIKGIICEAIIGCYDYEKTTKQQVVVDLECKLYSYQWITDDSLAQTVNYDELIELVRQHISNTQYNLLESLAQYLTQYILDKFSLIQSITVVLAKPALQNILGCDVQVKHTQVRKYHIALALGSNASNLPKQQLITAIELLGKFVSDIEIGGFYETKPVGFADQANFYNTAMIGTTELPPQMLFAKIKAIEKLMGKHEIIENGPRVIDIDILLIEQMTCQINFLCIPHPRLHERDFVLKPLCDVAANWVHPVLTKTMQQLLQQLQPDTMSIVNQVPYAK